MLKVTHLNVTRLFIVEMTDSKPVELDPYHHACALSCFGWKCLVCGIEAKDQIGLKMAWPGDEKVVYTDRIDGSKWLCCNGCKKCFHLSCVTGDTEEQVEARGGHFFALSTNARKNKR